MSPMQVSSFLVLWKWPPYINLINNWPFNGYSSAHQGCIYLIKIQKGNVLLWIFFVISNIGFLFYIILNTMYSCEAKLNFQQSLLQSSVSHDPSEIILIFWIIIIVETVVLLNCFGTCDTFFFDSLMNTTLKRTAFIPNKKLFSQYKSLLSPFIHLTHPSWIKVLLS